MCIRDSSMAALAESDLRECGVRMVGVRRYVEMKQPTAQITVNGTSRSRTVVLYNSLAELEFEDFKAVDWSTLKWVHLEIRRSRSEVLLRVMKELLADRPNQLTLSIEPEKPTPTDLPLAAHADVVLCSREFAECLGFDSAVDFLRFMDKHAREGTIVVCAWGKAGAHAVLVGQAEAVVHHSPAFPPIQEVDTIGAGDTFNACMIRWLHHGVSLESALREACRCAGFKVGVEGFRPIQAYNGRNMGAGT
eukprot:TRINITY_DN50356_c0_g1_i1.p1 TRINITY_DN50356_c0_g1~~TRINITY_DN50356_c0_g1_i1.p1  ORF type:complete len:249 (-),score=60.42 TRINITY_DN50356_c0_g1_i1:31-777(-)